MSESADERLREASRWLRYALDDLTAARVLAADVTVPPRQVCWLAQQAAEKALKAALCFLQTEFGKTHNLNTLRNLLPSDWMVRSQYPDLAELTAWAIEARYPGDWPEATEDDARRALETASGVLNAVGRDLAQRGFPVDSGGRHPAGEEPVP